MTERHRPPPERGPSHGPADDLGAPLADSLVALTSGPYGGQLPLAGRTVGEVRRRYGDRYDIAPQMQALVDNVPVDDATVLRAGQVLTFQHLSGEKGGTDRRIVIEGETVTMNTPEGQELLMPLADWLEAFEPARFDHGLCPLPDGVVAFRPMRDGVILVHQSQPSLRRLRWLTDDSPAPFGEDAVYREVTLALPYVLVLAVFRRGPDGLLALTSDSEAFFRNEPLRSLDDGLQYPALLNCSRIEEGEGPARSWVCVQHLRADRRRPQDTDALRLRSGLGRLLRHFWEAGFNRSSERHEGASWFGETVAAGIDPRVAGVDAWERASAEDPNFVLDVPWLEAGLDLGGTLDRMAGRLGRLEDPPRGLDDLVRPVLLHNRKESPLERRRRELLEAHAAASEEGPF